jgi:PKD repeat protein
MSASAIAQLEYLPDPNTATLPPGPIAQIQVSANDLTIEFDGSSSSGSPDAYVWDFGDGNSATGANVTHTYAAPGDYTVTLTVVNLAGEDSETQTITVGTPTPSPSGSASPSSSPSPSPTPFNCYPPNVIGMSLASAQADLINAGFNVSVGTLSTGQKDKVQAQNPDHTQCLAPGTVITILYRPS